MSHSLQSLSQTTPKDLRSTLTELQADTAAHIVSAARELLLEYGHFVQAHSNIASFCLGALEMEAANLPHSYLDQGGGSILATIEDQPVGFVAWRSLANLALASAWELKRLWIRPEARSAGLGRTLVETVIDRAQTAGKKEILLDTAPTAMSAAHRLYLSLGFTECPSYNGPSTNNVVYMQKSL